MHNSDTEIELFTTGQVAKLCSVTADTVLKWIKSGRVRATRTVGGHHRIPRKELLHLLADEQVVTQGQKKVSEQRHFQYCWEYNSNKGVTLENCTQCVVYQTRAYRCYEVIRLAPEAGHAKLFCKKTCEQCDYYLRVHKQATNVLVVSNNQILTASLKRNSVKYPLNLEITDCEYACSALVEIFRPDFAVVDCSMGVERSRDISKHLMVDPRIPYIRVILAANSDEFPKECDKEIFARIEKPFDMEDIFNCINGVRQKRIVRRKDWRI